MNLSHFSSREISILIKKARRVLTHPGLHVLMNPSMNGTGRILVITSRKIGNAPTRNKIRRRLKALFYEEQWYLKKIDCVVIIKPHGAHFTFENLKELLTQAFQNYATNQTHCQAT